MESKHTHEPGPWILGGASGRMITTPSGYMGDGFIADVDTLANAKLIVCAPEMLEALEKLTSRIKEINGWVLEPEYKAAMSVIRKAKGGSR